MKRLIMPLKAFRLRNMGIITSHTDRKRWEPLVLKSLDSSMVFPSHSKDTTSVDRQLWITRSVKRGPFIVTRIIRSNRAFLNKYLRRTLQDSDNMILTTTDVSRILDFETVHTMFLNSLNIPHLKYQDFKKNTQQV